MPRVDLFSPFSIFTYNFHFSDYSLRIVVNFTTIIPYHHTPKHRTKDDLTYSKCVTGHLFYGRIEFLRVVLLKMSSFWCFWPCIIFMLCNPKMWGLLWCYVFESALGFCHLNFAYATYFTMFIRLMKMKPMAKFGTFDIF